MAYLTKAQTALAKRQRDLRDAQQTLLYHRIRGNQPHMAIWSAEVKRRLSYCWAYKVEAEQVSRTRLPQNIFLPAVNAP
jgi:hypothetical protein